MAATISPVSCSGRKLGIGSGGSLTHPRAERELGSGVTDNDERMTAKLYVDVLQSQRNSLLFSGPGPVRLEGLCFEPAMQHEGHDECLSSQHAGIAKTPLMTDSSLKN